jgi:hypothetical protein
MDRENVVFIPCEFRRGGFPSERLFVIRVRGGEFRSVADVRYCYREDRSPLGALEPAEGQSLKGLVLGLIVRPQTREGEAIRVHLPDGEVYDLDVVNVVPARGAVSKHVPVQS